MGRRIRREAHFGRMMRCFAERPSNIDALLREAMERRPEATALVAGDCRMSYRALDQGVERIAANLARNGLKRGDRVALLLGNRPEFLLTVLAAARLGAIVVPMNIRQRRPEIQFMLAHSGATMLIFESALADELPGASELPDLEHRFVVGVPSEGAQAFEALMAPGEKPSFSSPEEEDPFCILYTSGTTGRPKGAVLTHFGLVHSVMHFEQALGLRVGDVAALAVPASHVTGLVAILLQTLRVAGTTVMMTEFKAGHFITLVEREKINYALMVPAMYNLCLMAPELTTCDLSSWRVGGFGGAPMPEASVQRLAAEIPGLGLSNIYGATETSSPVSVLSAADIADHSDTVGQILPCAEVIVVNREGQEVETGEVGELLIAGPMTIPFYWNNPEANEGAFIGGYWRSGDLGSVDAQGYLRIHDRIKDVVNRGGYKIYCIEVENVISSYPGIDECAVVGYPDTVLGERVAAFVRGPAAADQAAIREHCAERLSDYKVPEVIMALDQPLPRNANGKVAKNDLRTLVGPGR
ncbi:MAG TPA: class I adenylate-forming enzyme family protein [Allosphingosinicella sp.]|nr:class I adenylate-forming enzyme family protein [Allosphingosinicella sp.]